MINEGVVLPVPTYAAGICEEDSVGALTLEGRLSSRCWNHKDPATTPGSTKAETEGEDTIVSPFLVSLLSQCPSLVKPSGNLGAREAWKM